MLQVTKPFELVGMDLIGKLKTTKAGNQYICVMIDYLTKWPQAYAITSKTAEEVSQCILKFFYQFEAPKRILTDQGREFVNEVCVLPTSNTYMTFIMNSIWVMTYLNLLELIKYVNHILFHF